MPAGAVRLVPFLTASVVVHAIVFVAAGPESLRFNTAPAGEGHKVSIRLEAAAPAGAAADPAKPPPAVPAEARQTESESRPSPPTPDSARVAEIEPPPEPPTESKRDRAVRDDPEPAANIGSGNEPADDSEPQRERVTEEMDSRTAELHARAAERVAAVEDSVAGTASTSSEAQRAKARNAIVAELAKHFRYPRLAQRHGWEGTVVLSVRILPDGRLDDIRITRSSGRALLDRSARQALAGVERLPQFADRVGEDGLALEIPVTYRLESA